MKTVTYTGRDNKSFTVQYDENAPCIVCGLPVVEASMGGTLVCPWCDCGRFRDGTQWDRVPFKSDSPQRQQAFQKSAAEHAGLKYVEPYQLRIGHRYG